MVPFYKGYIGHIMVGDRSVPQSIQQLVIRNYCERNNIGFLLSATEFENSLLIFNSIKEVGVVTYSIWNLPEDKAKRLAIYASIIAANKVMLFAAENMAIRTQHDADRLEDIFMVRAICKK